jgi:hypothetical protein
MELRKCFVFNTSQVSLKCRQSCETLSSRKFALILQNLKHQRKVLQSLGSRVGQIWTLSLAVLLPGGYPSVFSTVKLHNQTLSGFRGRLEETIHTNVLHTPTT